jgi:hypothetical protein
MVGSEVHTVKVSPWKWRPARFYIYAIAERYVLISSQLPHWRCTGSSIEEVLRDCACSLRTYAQNVESITSEEALFIAEALTLRDTSERSEHPIRWI